MSAASSDNDLYSYCSSQLGEDASSEETLQCFSSQLQGLLSDEETPTFSSRDVLILFAASMVFLMQAGFAMVVAGAVQKKNVGNSMLKNLLDACGGSLAFFAIGYAFAFGGATGRKPEGRTFIGNTNFFLQGVDDYAFWLFQYTFSAASATIVAGTLAERCQMGAYVLYSVLLCGFVYPVVAHSVWTNEGFLSLTSSDPLFGVGMIDFAGSAVVHLTGGFTALLATIILGPRQGRFYDEDGYPLEDPAEFPQHSVALQMLGTFILWFGWYGFNGGSALLLDVDDTGLIAALAGVNTALAGGSAGVTALLGNVLYLEQTTGEPIFDLKYAMNGALCGLVAITGGCGIMEPWAAVVTGIVAGLLYIVSSRTLVALRLDDAVDAIPIHMVNGIWGVLAVGLFASTTKLEAAYGQADHPGWFYSVREDGGSDGSLFWAQLIGVIFILGWVFCLMLPFFIFLNQMGWFRSDPLEEIVGLDVSYHGGVHLAGVNHHADAPQKDTLEAFKKMREEKRERRRGSRSGDLITKEGGSSDFAAGAQLDTLQHLATGVTSHASSGPDPIINTNTIEGPVESDEDDGVAV